MKIVPFIRWYDIGEKVVICKKCDCHICRADDIISKVLYIYTLLIKANIKGVPRTIW